MADADGGGPVWSGRPHRRRGDPLVGLVVTLLALFGALTAVLGVKERSVAGGGVIIDGWIDAGWRGARRLAGQADERLPEEARTAITETGEAIQEAGEAVERGAEDAAERLSGD